MEGRRMALEGGRMAGNGPLPVPGARRRNAPTIPTTNLKAGGRTDPPPPVPEGYEFGAPARAWWEWAWTTPQACAWDDGSAYVVARRALLEDHMAALSFSDELDANDLFAAFDREAKERVEWALSLLRRSATGEVSLMKEMRELENKLGLSPEAMAKLRWKIVAEDQPPAAQPAPKKSSARERGHLRAVDPAIAG